MSKRMIQRAVAVAACATALVGVSATAATAGEITRGGKSLKYQPEEGDPRLHGKSECAYSGLNDEWVEAQLTETEADDDTYARVQSPAEFVGVFPVNGIPGYACNPAGARP